MNRQTKSLPWTVAGVRMMWKREGRKPNLFARTKEFQDYKMIIIVPLT
jgi:hypothetical protein